MSVDSGDTQAVSEGVTTLADLLHELRVGCDPRPRSAVDVGLGYEHTGDHESDAARLVQAISAFGKEEPDAATE